MNQNYKVIYIDYVQNGIDETTEDADDELFIYNSLNKAKRKLLWFLNSEIQQIKERVLSVKRNEF
jgi:hypothetical protein